MKKNGCDHFWEIDILSLDFNKRKKQKHVCMNCGKIAYREIPVLNLEDFEKVLDN
jgi:hypothetical protein